jgi:hypothetical protein
MYFIVVPFCSTEMFEKVRKLSSVLKNIPGDIKPRQNQTEKIEIGIYNFLVCKAINSKISKIYSRTCLFVVEYTCFLINRALLRQQIVHNEIPCWRAGRVTLMVFDTTYNNISIIIWRSLLLVEETAVTGKPIELTQVCLL